MKEKLKERPERKTGEISENKKNEDKAGSIKSVQSGYDRLLIISRLLIILGIVVAISAFCLHYMGKSDYMAVVKWWMMLLIIGLIFSPLALILFSKFQDNGWFFSKTLGIAVSAWLLWYLSSMKLMKFTRSNCVIVLTICLFLNIFLFWLYNKKSENPVNLSECFSAKKICKMLDAELIFFILFTTWCYVKGFNSAAYGTERFMDYAYVQGILKSEYMPPKDTWYAGKYINYYYVGQYISAYLVRLCDVGAGYGYNLMMMTLAAFGFCLPYSLVSNVLYNALFEKSNMDFREKKKRTTIVRTGAVLSGVSVAFAGNMHFPIYKWIMPKIQRIRGEEVKGYWFADATRYIGYNPDVDDKTIHEFPSYSFVLGDLHAHVINIIFVITVLALLFAWLIQRKPLMDLHKKQGKYEKVNFLKETISPWLLCCMFFIGLFHMTNYWDFPIYFVVCGAVILFCNLITYRFDADAIILTALQAVAFVLVWMVVSLPFTLSFDSISTSISFCTKHTRFYQLMVLWGLPLCLVLTYFISKLVKAAKIRKAEKEAEEEETEEEEFYEEGKEVQDTENPDDSETVVKKKKPGRFLLFWRAYFDSLSLSDLFIITIGLCAIGLVILPEIIYVVDIYGGAYQRSNTMFKLVYQAFIMFGIAMPYIIMRMLTNRTSDLLKRIAVVGLVCLSMTFCYFFECLDAWFAKYYKSLDASYFLAEEQAQDKKGVDWINANVPDDAVVLEMCGLSYTFFNRISVFTGNETVLGWQTHEWLWRSSGERKYPEENTERHNDVIEIYTTNDVTRAQELIKKYNIAYIYVGEAERYDGYASGDSRGGSEYGSFHGGTYKKIPVNDALLKELGEVIPIADAGDGYQYETYIVKVDPYKIIDETVINPGGDYKAPTPKSITYSGYESKVDFAGNEYVKTVYTYDADGNVIKEENFNAENRLVSYTESSYKDGKPEISTNYTADKVISSFWNFVDFDIFGHCTKKHCFKDDSSWWYTVDTIYNDNGSILSETITYADHTHEYIDYTYDDNDFLETKRTEGDNEFNVHLIQYTNNGERIFSAVEAVDGVVIGTMRYMY